MTAGAIHSVLGDLDPASQGIVYAHEHFIIDSALIEAAFPHIHLFDVDSAVTELTECRETGVTLAIDAMPCASGRRIENLAAISERSGVGIVAATGLHHNRYYGDSHWSNRVGVDELVRLFVDDLIVGIDLFDYTGPLVRRTDWRAGVVTVATSGAISRPQRSRAGRPGRPSSRTARAAGGRSRRSRTCAGGAFPPRRSS